MSARVVLRLTDSSCVAAASLGYADLGYIDGKLITPRIDSLRRSGIGLSSYYAWKCMQQLPHAFFRSLKRTPCCADCNPSRAMLLTGRYMHNVGIYSNGGSPSLDYALLPDRLKQASPGLRAVMIGKVRALESPRLVRRFCIAETQKAGVRSGIWAKPIAATPLHTEVLTTGPATMMATRIISRTPSPPGSVPSRAAHRKPTQREGAGDSARSM